MAAKKTSEAEKLTKYETARIIGARALQISMGAPFAVKLSEDDLKRMRYNPVEIAKLELQNGVIPLEIKRPKPDTMHEAAEEKATTDIQKEQAEEEASS